MEISDGYIPYLLENDISEVNAAVVQDFISYMDDGNIYIELDGDDRGAEVKALIDRLAQIDCKATVHIMRSLENIEVYRMPLDEDYDGYQHHSFRSLCVKGFNGNKSWCIIAPEPNGWYWESDWTEYQSYYYSPIKQ